MKKYTPDYKPQEATLKHELFMVQKKIILNV